MNRFAVPIVLALLTIGCGLSPEQSAALARYERAVAEIETRLETYEGKIEAVVEAYKAGRIPLEETRALLAEVGGGYSADKERLVELRKSVKELREQEVPWWAYIGPAVLAAIGFLGGRVPGWKTQRVLAAVVEGVEKSGDNKVLKEDIRDAADLAGVGPELHEVVKRLT